jgi:tight adherence protein B
MLQAMAASLSAGLTLQQAAESVARDGRPPVSEEVRRALVEVRLGMPLEDALDRVAVRMGSPDFAWVVMATRIQREVGGNLPVLLDVVAGTLRDRDRVRRQARVLSAEGRISAWVVGVLPIAFACYMLVVRPGYLAPLVSDPFGWAMLLGGSTLFVLGAIWLARLSRLKV